MKKYLLIAAALLGTALAIPIAHSARTLDVGGSGDSVQLLNNWNMVKEELFGNSNSPPTKGKTGKNRLFVFGTAGDLSTEYTFAIFDDFIYQTILETDAPWILNSGADAQAADPVISVQERGAIRLAGGDSDGTVGDDASQIVLHIPVQADSDGLVFESRLKMNGTPTTNDSIVVVGFTDISTLTEYPVIAGASGASTWTTNATDAVVFVYDTNHATDQWSAIGVDGGTDAGDNALTGTAPTADTYQVLRIEVDSDGERAKFYIDGNLQTTLTGTVTSATTNLYATILVGSNGSSSPVVDIDYIYVGHDR